MQFTLRPDLLRSRRILIFGLLLAILLCLPAEGTPITAGISSGPSTGSQLSAAAYEKQGIALRDQGNWDQLIAIADEGLSLYPDNAELFCLKGYALRKTGYYAEAVDNISRGIARDPKPVRYANRGYALLALNRYNDALSDADTAIALNAAYTPAYGVRALALLHTGNLTGASEAVDTAMAADPNSAYYWHLKGKVMAASGNCSAAAEAFNRSLSINPDYSLPWPDFPSATTDLENARTACAVPINTTPETPRAGLPAILAGAALAIGILGRIR